MSFTCFYLLQPGHFYLFHCPEGYRKVSGSIPEGKRQIVPKGPPPIERVLLLHAFCAISGAISEQRNEPPFPAPFPCLCKPAFRKRAEAPGRSTRSKTRFPPKW